MFEGHFPGHPLLPGVLMIETIAQTGGWLVLAVLRFQRMPFLVQVKEAKLRAFVVPGQSAAGRGPAAARRLGLRGGGGQHQFRRPEGGGRRDHLSRGPLPQRNAARQMLETARRVAVPEAFLHG